MANPKINAEQIDVGTGANQIPQLDGSGNVLTAVIDTGTGANQIVQLDGSGNLPAIDGSAITGLSGGTTGSLAVNGYAVLDNGLIMNWGYVPFNDINNSWPITFPLTFPNALFSVTSTGIGSVQGGGTDDFWLVWTGALLALDAILFPQHQGTQLQGFTIFNGYDGDKGAYWFATGY